MPSSYSDTGSYIDDEMMQRWPRTPSLRSYHRKESYTTRRKRNRQLEEAIIQYDIHTTNDATRPTSTIRQRQGGEAFHYIVPEGQDQDAARSHAVEATSAIPSNHVDEILGQPASTIPSIDVDENLVRPALGTSARSSVLAYSNSQHSTSEMRGIRVVSKCGEEAFIPLASSTSSRSSISRISRVVDSGSPRNGISTANSRSTGGGVPIRNSPTQTHPVVDDWRSTSDLSQLLAALDEETQLRDKQLPHTLACDFSSFKSSQPPHAGRGWISPHPLSIASGSDVSLPQSHISYYCDRKGEVVKMAYQEWLALCTEKDLAPSVIAKPQSPSRLQSPPNLAGSESSRSTTTADQNTKQHLQTLWNGGDVLETTLQDRKIGQGTVSSNPSTGRSGSKSMHSTSYKVYSQATESHRSDSPVQHKSETQSASIRLPSSHQSAKVTHLEMPWDKSPGESDKKPFRW